MNETVTNRMYRKFNTNNDKAEYFNRVCDDNINESNVSSINQLKKSRNYRNDDNYHDNKFLSIQQQLQEKWQNNNGIIDVKQNLFPTFNDNENNKISKRHHQHSQHNHHDHHNENHNSRYNHESHQHQIEVKQNTQHNNYYLYNGNNNNNNINKKLNYNDRQWSPSTASSTSQLLALSPKLSPNIYRNKHEDNDTYDVNTGHFNLYRNNCDMDEYHHKILPKKSDNLRLTNLYCQNPAYEQHYQHYYSYFYKTSINTFQKQKQQHQSEGNRRKLPTSPILVSTMPYIKESLLGNLSVNENDIIGVAKGITNVENHNNYQRHHYRSHNRNRNVVNNCVYNVLREKTINSNNIKNNNDVTSNDTPNVTYADAYVCHVNSKSCNDNCEMYIKDHNVDDLKVSGDFLENTNDCENANASVNHYVDNDIHTTERVRKIIQKNKHRIRKSSHVKVPGIASPVHLNRLKGGKSVIDDDEDSEINYYGQRHNKQSSSKNKDNNNDNVNDRQQPVKLPSTPVKPKVITVLRKPSPPSPRNSHFSIYNTQSLGLTRPSRLRMLRSSRNYLNHEITSTTQVSQRNKLLPGKVQVLKSMSPIKMPDVRNDYDNTDIDDVSDYDDLDNVSDFNDSDASDISSESEEGYRSYAYKLTHPINHSFSEQAMLTSSEYSLINPKNLLTPSLFPNVPPYLSFSSNIEKGPDIPADLYRVLKWRVSNVMPRVVRCILANSGMRLLKKTNDWMGVWGKHMKSPCFKSIRSYQKINHIPGSFRIGRKDTCWKNLVKLTTKYGKKDFGFMPKTYIIPNDLHQLRKSWPKYAQKNVKWIIKPPASARGTGIRVVDRWAQIPKRKPLIVQKYIERPLLINGSKFDLRLYVLVTSINPLRVYMYHNGLARFASVKYSDKSESLSDRCMHLTNYSINKLSSNYSKNEDVNACHGHKWTIKSLWNYLSSRGVRVEYLWEALRNLVLRTILAGENSINSIIKANLESKYSCYELFGFDVLLDADLVPWLLEVNISPSLHSELPLDSYVKAPLVQSVLNTALYNVPPKIPAERQREIASEMCLPTSTICYDKRLYINYLSRVEKIKHNTFTRKTMEDRDEYIEAILERLTPDDVRCLIVAEDELARSKPLERIFPTADTYKYLKYTESPRYYNRLLDAWETRYSNNRSEGIELLRQLCQDKYHLQVPQTPAKKYYEDDSIDYYKPDEKYTAAGLSRQISEMDVKIIITAIIFIAIASIVLCAISVLAIKYT